jgi:tetratricopeptide (TPR) repeat protein
MCEVLQSSRSGVETVLQMLTALPPLMAYRADTAGAPDAHLPDDAQWLTFAVQLAKASRLPDPVRRDLLTDLVRAGEPATGPIETSVLCERAIATAVKVATAMEDAARFHLAFSTLTSALVLLPEANFRMRGRILAQQGRIARQLGEMTESRLRFEAVEQLATEHGDNELFARAWIGFGVLAQLRGNYPEVRKIFGKVLSLDGISETLRRLAHRSLIVAACTAKDFDTGAVHAWAAFQDAQGEAEAEGLIYLAEVFLQAGHPRTALKGFGAALLRPLVARYELPALGGAAVAAARALRVERARPLVERYATRIQTIITATQLPYANASALADIGDAYAALGAPEAATSVRGQARIVAERHGFHELAMRLERSENVAGLKQVATLRAAAVVAEAVNSFETTADVTRALAEALV